MKRWMVVFALLAFTGSAWAVCDLTTRNVLQDCYVGTRLYKVLVPSKYAVNGPLVIAFHGKGDTAAGFASTSGLVTTAKTYGYVVVFAQGEISDDGTRTWNGYWNEFFQKTPVPDDVGYSKTIIVTLEASGLAINPKQVFLTGFSNGGWVEHRIAAELGSDIAAISTMGSATFIEPTGHQDTLPAPTAPVSALMFLDDAGIAHGGSLYCGGYYAKDGTTRGSADDTFDYWQQEDGAIPNTNLTLCTGEGGLITSLNMKTTTGGVLNTAVTFYRLIGGVHKWYGATALNVAPGNSSKPYNPNFNTKTGITMVDIASKFLLAHPKP